jgi:N-acetylmuramic acid 6-phosphate (MurNAc-6-P) etherase
MKEFARGQERVLVIIMGGESMEESVEDVEDDGRRA